MAINDEQLLISSVLRDKDFALALSNGIKPSQFHSYGDEWTFLEDYFSKYKKLPSRMAFVRQFPDFRVKEVNDTGHFSTGVLRQHSRFRLTSSMNEVTNFLAGGNVEAAIKLMSQEIVGIAAETGAGADVDVLAEWGSVYTDAAERQARVNSNGLAGMATGFPTLDQMTGGPQPGQFWVIAARLGEGKSWLMQRMAAAALMMDHKIQYNTLEMSRHEVTMRMHTILSANMGAQVFSNLDLQQGHTVNMTEYKQFLGRLKAKMKNGGLHVTDGSRGRISPLTIAAQIIRNNPDAVFVDYITLMEGVAGGDWKTLAQLTGDLKQIAAQYEVPVIGAAQLNRTATGKDPGGTESLAQGDSIGQDADVVLSSKKMTNSALMVKCVKNRHGASDWKFYIDFRPAKGIFEECSYDDAMDLKDQDADEADRMAYRKAKAASKTVSVPITPVKTLRKSLPTKTVPSKTLVRK